MAPKSKTKKAIAGSYFEEGPAPVWLAQINEHKFGVNPVRLPQNDCRRPRQEQAIKEEHEGHEEEGTVEGVHKQEEKLIEFGGEDASERGTEQMDNALQGDAKAGVATRQTIDNLKYWPVNPVNTSFTSSYVLPSKPFLSPPLSPSPSTIQPQLSPQPRLPIQSQILPRLTFDVQSTSKSADQSGKTVRAWPFNRGTRGRGDPRNAGMREAQARFRAELASQKSGSFKDKMVLQKSPQRPVARDENIEAPQQQSHNNDAANNVTTPTASSNKFNFRSPRRPSTPQPHINGNSGSPQNPSRFNNLARSLKPRLPQHDKPPTTSLPYRQDGPLTWRQDDWTSRPELRIRVYGIPFRTSTAELWKCFSKEGSVTSIDIADDRNANKAFIRFSPPPARAFWLVNRHPLDVKGLGTIGVRVELEAPNRSFLVSSPANPEKKYPETITMVAESVEFGFMYDPKTMMRMYRADQPPRTDIQFRQNLCHGEVVIQFQISIRDARVPRPGSSNISPIPDLGKFDRKETIRFSVKYPQLQVIHKVRDSPDKFGLVISLETPPKFFRKWDEVNTHEENSKYWKEFDAWYRQTDIVYNPAVLKNAPLTIKKSEPIIDIGRWTTYHLVFDKKRVSTREFDMMCDAFRDHNVQVKDFPDFNFIPKQEPHNIDKPTSRQKKTSSTLAEIVEGLPTLEFPVRYQLEVCLSHGYLNEHNITTNFIRKLNETDPKIVVSTLEHIAIQKKRVFDPMKIFDSGMLKATGPTPKLPHYCALTRSATITPSTIYFNTPSVETTNRVIRQYAEHSDRFLRVRFSDEKNEGRIRTTEKGTMNEVFTRIKRAMANGIDIGDRHYEFLAFGNSQFRENGAYFFAPTSYLSAAKIRAWMGSFSEIKVVAKYAARIGQCFSTTRAISGSKAKVVEIQDVYRNDFCFTDGVGKLSAFLAQLVALELGISTVETGPPSVFQFRLGGCKGVVAVSPDAKSREIHIRPSQYKFAAPHEGLEIIRWSQFAGASLNRQLILVLSTLGVPDDTFTQKLKTQLSNLELAMTDEKMALNLLQKDIDVNQMTLVVAGLILEGFQRIQEPFVTSLLQLWRAWSIKYLKEKAKISINDGALLLGCTDETGKLKGHFDAPAISEDSMSTINKEELLPQVFVQLSKGPKNKPWVVKGPMLLARNPSLHPGDIRVVLGVDIPELHYLKDVVAFPQTGDRDLASMCSGGDLDGDDYLVMWDKDLLDHEWNHEPMDYKPPKPLEVDREICIDDITSFFVQFMKNDNLPTIAHAHVAQADDAEDGVKAPKCLKLAALHSTAVDYFKSGQPARMSRELKPRRWPHFMEKTFQPKHKIYNSRKILGKLYDQVERIDFTPAFSAPFDKRILDAYEHQDHTLLDAMALKREYDTAMNRIMAQHEIRTEFEVWSTFVLHHSNHSKDFKFHEIIWEISTSLKDQFREACYQKAGGKGFEHIGPFVAAMYKVTSEEMARALEECHKTTLVDGEEKRIREMAPQTMPLMSFPWLFQDILGKIANGIQPIRALDQTTQKRNEVNRALPKEKVLKPTLPKEEDVLETAEGFTRRDEILKLFDDSLIDYGPDGEEVASGVNPSTDLPGVTSYVNNMSIDDMLLGDSVDKLTEYKGNPNQQNFVYTKPRVDNLSTVMPDQKFSSDVIDGDEALIDCNSPISRIRSTQSVASDASRSNLDAAQTEFEDSTLVKRDSETLKDSSSQDTAELSVASNTVPNSYMPSIRSRSEDDTSPEEDLSGSDLEEEIVNIDLNHSVLDPLAGFNEV